MFIQSKAFLEKLIFVNSGTMSKASPEFYGYIFIEVADTGHLSIRSFSGNTHYKVTLGKLHEKTLLKPSSIRVFPKVCFDSKRVTSSLKKLDDSIFIHINLKDNVIIFKSKNSVISEPLIPADGFIDMPIRLDGKKKVNSPNRFLESLKLTIAMCDPDSLMPACRGLQFKCNSERTIFCGTDTHLTSICIDNDNIFSDSDIEGIIPVDAIEKVSMLLAEAGVQAEVILGEDNFGFETDDTTITCSCLDTKQLPYEMIYEMFDKRPRSSIIGKRLEILRAIQFVAKYSANEFGQISISGSGDSIKVFSHGADTRYAEFDVKYDIDEPFNLVINSDNMIKSLRSLSSKMIRIIYTTDRKDAMVIEPLEDGGLNNRIIMALPYNPNEK